MKPLETETLQAYPVFAKFDHESLQKILGSIEVYKTGANKLCLSGNECQGFTLVFDGRYESKPAGGAGLLSRGFQD